MATTNPDLLKLIKIQMVKNDYANIVELSKKTDYSKTYLWRKMSGDMPITVNDLYRLGDALGWDVEVAIVLKDTGERIPFTP